MAGMKQALSKLYFVKISEKSEDKWRWFLKKGGEIKNNLDLSWMVDEEVVKWNGLEASSL